MGTYMSAYIEVDYGRQATPFSDPVKVHSITDGSFSFDKSYDVFDALAGGRYAQMAPEDRDSRAAPLIPARGMPSPCSAAVGWDYFRLVAEPPHLPDPHFWADYRVVSSHTAEEWLQHEHCHEAEFFQWFNCKPPGQTWRVVSAPGLYNASWLTLHDLDASLAHHGLNLETLPVQFRVLRSCLCLLVEEYGMDRVRLVVWFS